MTISQAAIVLESSPDFVERLIRRGELRDVEKRGREYRIPEGSVELWRLSQRVRFGSMFRASTQALSRVRRLSIEAGRQRRALR